MLRFLVRLPLVQACSNDSKWDSFLWTNGKPGGGFHHCRFRFPLVGLRRPAQMCRGGSLVLPIEPFVACTFFLGILLAQLSCVQKRRVEGSCRMPLEFLIPNMGFSLRRSPPPPPSSSAPPCSRRSSSPRHRVTRATERFQRGQQAWSDLVNVTRTAVDIVFP